MTWGLAFAGDVYQVGDSVWLQAGFAEDAPGDLASVTWTYTWPKDVLTLKSMAQAANVYYEVVPSPQGDAFDAIQIKWVNDGTTVGPVNAAVELEAIKDTANVAITLPTPEVQAVDSRGRSYGVEILSSMDLMIEPRPVVRWFFRLSRNGPPLAAGGSG